MNPNPNRRGPQPWTRLACAVLLAALPLAAWAQDADAPRPPVSPEAQAVLDRMTAFLRAQQAFTIDSEATRDEVVSHGYKLKDHETSTLSVQRPNRLRAQIDGDLRTRTIVYDGSRIALYSPAHAAYVRAKAPGTLAELVGRLFDAGLDLPLADVLYQATNGTLTEGVRGGVLVGTSTIDGVACDHLAFRQADVDWQMWVQQGATPLPRKIVITTRYEVGEPQFEASLRWNLAPKFRADTFTFVPPADAAEIAFDNAAALDGATP